MGYHKIEVEDESGRYSYGEPTAAEAEAERQRHERAGRKATVEGEQ